MQQSFELYTLSLLGLVVVVGFVILIVCCKKWIACSKSETTVQNTPEEPVYETISIATDETVPPNKDRFTLADNDAYTVLHFGSTVVNDNMVSNTELSDLYDLQIDNVPN